MNEQIRELAKQARQIGEYVNYGQIRLSPEQFEQKFAKLIVKECIKQVEKNFAGAVGTYAGAHNSAVLKCKKSIQEHFGVE